MDAHARRRRRGYEWVLKTRTDVTWPPYVDDAFASLPSSQVVSRGGELGAEAGRAEVGYAVHVDVYTAERHILDFFILTHGSRLATMMELPHMPCASSDPLGWGLWHAFVATHRLRVAVWPAWPRLFNVGIQREDDGRLLNARLQFCRRTFAVSRGGGVLGCSGLSAPAIDMLMRAPDSVAARAFYAHQRARRNVTGRDDVGGEAWEAAVRAVGSGSSSSSI